MDRPRLLKTALAAVISLTLSAAPALANPGHGNSGGNEDNPGHNGKQHGPHNGKAWHENGRSKGKQHDDPSQAEAAISFSAARALAENYGLTGYASLPPGIAKNVARGKRLPPGIARKALPAGMLNDLPHYPGYEWRAVGDDLVLIALSTAIVTAVINGVFD